MLFAADGFAGRVELPPAGRVELGGKFEPTSGTVVSWDGWLSLVGVADSTEDASDDSAVGVAGEGRAQLLATKAIRMVVVTGILMMG